MNKLNYEYKTLTPFKMQCLTSFPFIDEDFDALTNYELLCKIVEYLNQTRENQNIVQENIIALNNWFNNLDVTKEINDKLDSMVENGEFQQILNRQYQDLRNEVNRTINNFESNVNNTLTQQNNKINSLNNFEPIVVDDISKMTDISKIYLLTSDNNWYYYNGTNFVIGGTYNSQPIANGSIDVLMFDETLQNLFNLNYNETTPLTFQYQGYANVVDNKVEITPVEPGTVSYKYFIIPLELGSIYTYTGKNNDSARGLIVADSEDNVILYTSGNTINNTTFKVNQNGLKAYVGMYVRDTFESSVAYEFSLFKEANILRKLINITNRISQNITPSLVQNMENIACLNYISDEQLKMQSIQGYSTQMYSCKKGDKFRITYSDRYLVKGFYATDKNYITKYLGDSIQYPTTNTIDWTATFDGFIFLTQFEGFNPAIIKLLEGVEIKTDGLYSILKSKSIAYDGDSITQSRINQGNQSNGGAYPKLIADLTESNYVNNARGGATLSYKSGSDNCIARRLTDLPSNSDMYVFSGGINDMWDNRPLGVLTSNYTDEVDDTTVIGALEKIFRYALTTFVGKSIIFVITHKVLNPYTSYNNYNQFGLHDALVSVCEKYSIPYYDAFNESGLNGWNEEQRTTYLNSNSSGSADGTHPNELGYLKYYVPQMIELLNKNILQ